MQEVFTALKDGEFVVKKAELFDDGEDGKSIKLTFENLENRMDAAESDIENRMDAAESDIENIEDGTTIVEKALKDDLGNTIKSTYANKLDLAYSSSNNRIAVTLKSYDGTPIDTEVIDLPKATTTSDGLMSKEDKAYVNGLPSALHQKKTRVKKALLMVMLHLMVVQKFTLHNYQIAF